MMQTKITLNIVLALTLWYSAAVAQSEVPAEPPIDSTVLVESDSLPVADSLPPPLAESIDDSIRIVFPEIEPDTLSEAQRLLAEFETRWNLRQLDQEAIEALDRFSYADSLAVYYLSPRWQMREDIDRSFFFSAGDYFKSDPSFFVLEPQVLPMRKTVQPHGLAGNRLGVLAGGQPYRPFEHIVEPDGLIDLNDVPTALDHTVAILPGPVGLVFGGDHAVATLLTRPRPPRDTDPENAFILDKGGDGFSYTRGRYSKDFVGGRHIDMSIGYRVSDGPFFGRDDNAYHYTGDFLFPLNNRWEFQATGHLYDRNGSYVVRPDTGGVTLERNRIDRSGQLTLSRYNEYRTSKDSFGYRHVRQGSTLEDGYRMNLNQTGHGLFARREWQRGATVWHAQVGGDYLQYDSWSAQYDRYSAGGSLGFARLSRPWGYAVNMSQVYVDGFKYLPSASGLIRRETETAYFLASAGYSERAPSLNELYLPRTKGSIYGTGVTDYTDRGNASLSTERQLIGTVELALGRLPTSIMVTATGGRLWHGIDWQRSEENSITTFTPRNGDIDFVGITGIARLNLWDAIDLKTGGSYRYLDYENFEDKPYTPEYQFFSGGELHLFWSQKLIDLYAYGEVVYTGPYDGYLQANLGNTAVINTKLSFRMGNFRFHWISQNAFLLDYFPRDYFRNAYRYTSYGFTWEFFD